jgi:hypothetical protein
MVKLHLNDFFFLCETFDSFTFLQEIPLCIFLWKEGRGGTKEKPQKAVLSGLLRLSYSF